MTMNRDTAKELVARFEKINSLIFSLPSEFEDKLSPEELKALRREVGRMGAMADSYVYPVLLKHYPDLHPLNDETSRIGKVAKEYDVTREKIRQIEEKALRKLQDNPSDDGPDVA